MLRTLRNITLAVGLGLGSLGCNDSDSKDSRAVASEAFSLDAVLDETDTPEESPNARWWLNSGAQFITRDGTGYTLAGDVPPENPWHDHYALHNPEASDNGYHPQNVFRLFGREMHDNARQECEFLIRQYHVSISPSRKQSNGILIVSRYQDNDNHYYAGLRVDGQAVIKKKLDGTYSTLAVRQLYPGAYDRNTNPNLLPLNEWIGLSSEVKDTPNGVAIKLAKRTGNSWETILEAEDSGRIHRAGRNGLWTDFMDAEFKDYHVHRAE